MDGISVLGSTGSIGISTLDVVARHPDRFQVVALSANRQVERMVQQCQQFLPVYVVMADADAAEKLHQKLAKREDTAAIQVLSGAENLDFIASLPQVKYVMAAIVGAAGLSSSIAAAKAAKHILLANKESLVMSGDLFMDEVKSHGATLLPVDSEHNAIFQSLPGDYSGNPGSRGISQILLTASGGPFRQTPMHDLLKVTPDQACAHPNWDMGRKISVDSATMMNKGLEVIEASWLFDIPAADIQVVIHPESIIHSMVAYTDGSVLAQMGNPDMRTPIAHVLGWPDRLDSGVRALDLFEIAQLNFMPPDMQRFPCLKLAYEAIDTGGSAVTVLNAANEVAVNAFLNHQIAFLDIPRLIEGALQHVSHRRLKSLQEVFEQDRQAREITQSMMNGNT